MTRSVRRFLHLPRPGLTRTAQPAGLLAAGAMVLVAVLAFGQFLRSTPGPGESASPSPAAPPSVAPSATPATTPSAIPSDTPTESPTTRVSADRATPRALAQFSGDCTAFEGWAAAVSGDQLVVTCAAQDQPDWFLYMLQIDVRTNKVLHRFDFPNQLFGVNRLAFDSGQIWYSPHLGSSCMEPCVTHPYVERLDVATNKRTRVLNDYSLIGDGLGYVWVSQQTTWVWPKINTATGLTTLNPRTGAKVGTIPFPYETMQIACGSLWGLNYAGASPPEATTTLARIDPKTGQVLGTYTWRGSVGSISGVRDECWATGSTTSDETSSGYPNSFFRIGPSGIDRQSPALAFTIDQVWIQGGSFWVNTFDPALIQRVDPDTWLPTGPAWETVGHMDGISAGDTIWIDGGITASDTASDTALTRLDIAVTP